MVFNIALQRIRTSDLGLRRAALYPAELRADRAIPSVEMARPRGTGGPRVRSQTFAKKYAVKCTLQTGRNNTYAVGWLQLIY